MNCSDQRVFKWRWRRSWERALLQLLGDRIDATVIAEVRRQDPRYLRDDGFAWLNTSVVRVKGGVAEDIPALLGARLPSRYEFVTAFHASRLASPSDLLRYGVKPSDTEALQGRAVELFGESEALKAAVAELRQRGYERHSNGRIWLCLTKEAFLYVHDHYMLEGSEYLAAIAGRLGHTAKLREIGCPVIVECLVPTRYLDSGFWRSLGTSMLEDYFARLLRPAEKQPVCTTCIAIHRRLTELIGELADCEKEVGLQMGDLPQGRPCKIRPASQRAAGSRSCGNCAI